VTVGWARDFAVSSVSKAASSIFTASNIGSPLSSMAASTRRSTRCAKMRPSRKTICAPSAFDCCAFPMRLVLEHPVRVRADGCWSAMGAVGRRRRGSNPSPVSPRLVKASAASLSLSAEREMVSSGACAPREKNLFPSPRGEGGPRQAFSPAVAGRMRGYFRALDDRLPATHNRGWGLLRAIGIVERPGVRGMHV
jgi:hypothetical protein